MKLLIHDLAEDALAEILPDPAEGEPLEIISDDGTIHPCAGCFGCWVKTPGACVIRDGYGGMGALLSRCGELILISRCVYGSYSPFVKNVLDRSIPYLLPDFAIREGAMHHKMRYKNRLLLSVWFYGADIREAERRTAERLVRANALNLCAEVRGVSFVEDPSALKGRIG